MSDIKNATITSTVLGTEDHGILTFYLHLDYGGSGQSAGGYSLDNPLKDGNGKFIKRIGTAYGMQLIVAIMETVGVVKWEDLKGQHIRVEAEHNGVLAIGNFLKDNWLRFSDFKQA